MQKKCIDELDLFLLKNNISGSEANTLRLFHNFFVKQGKDVDMTSFLKQPSLEPAQQMSEATKSLLDTVSAEEKESIIEFYDKQNKDIKSSNFAKLYLHDYATFLNMLESLTGNWKKLKKEAGSHFYKNHIMLVEYKNGEFSLVRKPVGRPKTEVNRKRLSLRVDKDMLGQIENYCNSQNLSQQDFLLKAITCLINPEKDAVDNPILDLMKQRYDIKGNLLAEHEKIQKRLSNKH